MRFVSADRQTGKTEKLLHWFFERPDVRYVICVDEQRRHHMIMRATRVLVMSYEADTDFENNHEKATSNARLVGNHILSMDTFRRRLMNPVNAIDIEIAVDDFEDVLRRAVGCVPDLAVGSMVILSEYEVTKL